MDSEYTEAIANKCVHFNGLIHGHCRAGIAYDRYKLCEKTPFYRQLPCVRLSPEVRAELGLTTPGTCDLCQFPTEEEVERLVASADREAHSMRQRLSCVDEIRTKYKGMNWHGSIDCPVCGGRLLINHAAVNGRIWAKCQTRGCLAWTD